MKCPNCSAECSDQSKECDFCGHPFVASAEQTTTSAVPPPVAASEIPPPVTPYLNTSNASRRDVNIPNYLVWAIIATIVATLTSMFSCCCIPLGLPSGIAAIVYAMRVNKFVATGEISSAEQASKTAKLWTWVTTVIAIIFSLWLIAILVLQFTDPALMENLRKQIEAAR